MPDVANPDDRLNRFDTKSASAVDLIGRLGLSCLVLTFPGIGEMAQSHPRVGLQQGCLTNYLRYVLAHLSLFFLSFRFCDLYRLTDSYCDRSPLL